MNDNMQSNQPQPEYYGRRAARRQRMQERREFRATHVGGGWLGGALLILIGILFLFQNMEILTFGRWWALLILLPAASSLGTSWQAYQRAGGSLTPSAMRSLVIGLIFIGLAVVLFLDLNLTFLGPALIILAGFGLLFSGVFSK